eukprot:tig00000269_g23698.t1
MIRPRAIRPRRLLAFFPPQSRGDPVVVFARNFGAAGEGHAEQPPGLQGTWLAPHPPFLSPLVLPPLSPLPPALLIWPPRPAPPQVSRRAPYPSALVSGPVSGRSGGQIAFLSLTAPLIVPFGAIDAEAPTDILDRSGVVLGQVQPPAPPEICPAVAASNSWFDCWNMAGVTATRSGILYQLWSKSQGTGGRAIFAYRPPANNLIRARAPHSASEFIYS